MSATITQDETYREITVSMDSGAEVARAAEVAKAALEHPEEWSTSYDIEIVSHYKIKVRFQKL